MRPLLILLAFTSLLAGCAAAPGSANNAALVIPPPASAPASEAPPPANTDAPARPPRAAYVDRIKAALRVSGGGHQSIALEPKGRLVVTDLDEHVENELHVDDVDRVVYSNERGQPRPHCAQVWFKSTVDKERFRWRKDEGPWMLATSNYLPLCVGDKAAADDVVEALHSLIGR